MSSAENEEYVNYEQFSNSVHIDQSTGPKFYFHFTSKRIIFEALGKFKVYCLSFDLYGTSLTNLWTHQLRISHRSIPLRLQNVFWIFDVFSFHTFWHNFHKCPQIYNKLAQSNNL